MYKTIITLITLAVLALSSCTNTTKHTDEQQSTEKPLSTKPNHLNEHELALNNGQKWKVNKEMMAYLLESESLVNKYLQTPGTDYTTLADQLQVNVRKLTQSCTMKGKSHDELHKWLLPYLTLLDELTQTHQKEKAQEIILTLQSSFVTFHHYFD